MEQRPYVGIGVIVVQNNHVLLGERLSSHGKGYWANPGGHLEYKETFEECAVRELFEETGLKATRTSFKGVTNDLFPDHKHYVTIFMAVEEWTGNLKNGEPQKCKEWKWFEVNDLPNPLFLPFENFLKQHKVVV